MIQSSCSQPQFGCWKDSPPEYGPAWESKPSCPHPEGSPKAALRKRTQHPWWHPQYPGPGKSLRCCFRGGDSKRRLETPACSDPGRQSSCNYYYTPARQRRIQTQAKHLNFFSTVGLRRALKDRELDAKGGL